MLKYVLGAAALTLSGCTDLPQTSDRAPVVVGKTETGQSILRYQLTRSSAFSVIRIPETAIAARSAQVCPGGYRELGRSGQIERRISGTIYTDIKVTLVCT